LDEMDAIMGSRGGNDEHEGSRRMKTERRWCKSSNL
jgi:hypothetical protein